MQNIMGLLPFILMFVLFYFLLIRPQQKRQKAVRQMQSDLKKGTRLSRLADFMAQSMQSMKALLFLSLQTEAV